MASQLLRQRPDGPEKKGFAPCRAVDFVCRRSLNECVSQRQKNRERGRKGRTSIVYRAGIAKSQLTRPVPMVARSAFLLEKPDSTKTWDE